MLMVRMVFSGFAVVVLSPTIHHRVGPTAAVSTAMDYYKIQLIEGWTQTYLARSSVHLHVLTFRFHHAMAIIQWHSDPKRTKVQDLVANARRIARSRAPDRRQGSGDWVDVQNRREPRMKFQTTKETRAYMGLV